VAFNGTDVQGHAGGNSIFRGGHNFSHGLVALREQYLVSGLNLFNQVGKLSAVTIMLLIIHPSLLVVESQLTP
jgi:hypothetical protein